MSGYDKFIMPSIISIFIVFTLYCIMQPLDIKMVSYIYISQGHIRGAVSLSEEGFVGIRLKLVEFLTIISGAKSEINLAISF